jgi:hypothetical protein
MKTSWARLAVAATLFASFAAACGEPGEKLSYDPGADETPAEQEPVDDPTEPTDPEISCPHLGDALTDVTAFPSCAADAHCLPTGLLPAESAAKFDDCDDGESKCIPDYVLETKGNYVPATCESALSSEGRCVSRVMPGLDAKADSLPQDVCTVDELCVPCFDPFTSEPTGACEQGCDAGPTTQPIQLPTCCSGDGLCLPSEELGEEKAGKLGQDTCAQSGGPNVCVPTPFLNPDYQPYSCIDENLFGPDLPGVCLPECLPAVQGLLTGLLLDQEGCQAEYKCAPCDHPITGKPTGACDL